MTDSQNAPSPPSGGDNIDKALAGELLDTIVQPSQHVTMVGIASALQEIGIADQITREVLAGTHKVTQAEFDMTKQWKTDRMRDKDWVDQYLSGDREARRKMALANLILSGGIKAAPAA